LEFADIPTGDISSFASINERDGVNSLALSSPSGLSFFGINGAGVDLGLSGFLGFGQPDSRGGFNPWFSAGFSSSIGGMFFSDSRPTGYFQEAAYFNQHSLYGQNQQNGTLGFNGAIGPSLVFTNGKSSADIAGPFAHEVIAWGPFMFNLGKGANGIWTFTFGFGGLGAGVSDYCSNTLTSAADSAGFEPGSSPPGTNCHVY
jgi:hypothetical protein